MRQRARFHGFGDWVAAGGASGKRKRSLTLAEGIGRLLAELRRLGGSGMVLSTNVVLRLDGLPRSGQGEPDDPGAAAYFRLQGKQWCLACDRWDRVADNIAAIAAHVAAIRAVDRYGVGTLEQAFAGYAALPPSAADWWLILEVPRTATQEQIEDAFRKLARVHHPDVGGDGITMARLNEARDRALFELEGRR